MANEENRVGVISCADHAEWFAETLAGRLAGVDGVGGSIEEQLDYYQRAMNRIVVIDDDVIYGNKQAEDIIVNWVKTQGSPRVRLIVFCDNERDSEDPFFYRLVSDADVHDILLVAESGDPQEALLALIEEPATQLQYARWKTTDTSIWEEKKKKGLFPFGGKKKAAKKEKAAKKSKAVKKAKKAAKIQPTEPLSEEEPETDVAGLADSFMDDVNEDVEPNEPAEPGSLYDIDVEEDDSDAAVEPKFEPKKPVIDYSGLGDLDQKEELDEGNLSFSSPTLAMPKLIDDPIAKLNAELGTAPASQATVASPALTGPMPVVVPAPVGQVVLSLEEYNQLLLASQKPAAESSNVNEKEDVVEDPKAELTKSASEHLQEESFEVVQIEEIDMPSESTEEQEAPVEKTVSAGAFEVDKDDYLAKVEANEKALKDEVQEPQANETPAEEQQDEESTPFSEENVIEDPKAELTESVSDQLQEEGFDIVQVEQVDVPTGSGKETPSVDEIAAEPVVDTDVEPVREAVELESQQEVTDEEQPVEEAATEEGAVQDEKPVEEAVAPIDPKLNEIVTAAIEGAKVNGDGTVSLKLPQGDYGAFVSALRDGNGNALGVVSPTGKKTLAVSAVSHGLGATHTALALATELASHKVKVCVAMADEEDFAALAQISNDFEPVNKTGLRWRGCDIYRWTDQHEFSDGYDVAVVDCGVLDLEDENPSSPAAFFRSADTKLMLVGGAPWDTMKLAVLMNTLGTEALEGWNFGGAWLSQERGVEMKNLLSGILNDESIELWEVPSRPWLFDNDRFNKSAQRYAMILKELAPAAFKSVTPSENYEKKPQNKRQRNKQNPNNKPKSKE